MSLKSDSKILVGERVKKLRMGRGFSQIQLAQGICSHQTISNLELGKNIPSTEIMQKVADKLGVSLSDVMSEQVKGLNTTLQLEVVKVYIEKEEYNSALLIIDELLSSVELLEYQLRELILNKAECLMRTGTPDEAVAYLTNLQLKLEKEREKDDTFLAQVYNKLGNASFFASDIANAYAYYMRAYHLCLRFPETDFLAAQIIYNLGYICNWLGFYKDAESYLSKAYQFFEKGSNSKSLAQTMFALGINYKEQGELDKAETFLRSALALYESENFMKMAHRVKESYTYMVLSQSEPERAIYELSESTKEFEQAGDIPQLAYTLSRVALLCLQQNQQIEAQGYLIKSLSLFTEDLVFCDPRYAFVYRVYGNFLFSIKDFDTSVHYLYKSYEGFDKIGLVKEAADSLAIVVEIYEENGHLDRALCAAKQVMKLFREMKKGPLTTLEVGQ